MNDDLEAQLRRALSSVDQAAMSSVETVGERVSGVQRRRARRRRAVSGFGAATVTVAAVAMVWNTSTGPAQVTTGDGGATTTAQPNPEATSETTQFVTPPITEHVAWADVPPDPRGATTGASVVWTGTEALMVGGVQQDGEPRDGVLAFEPVTATWREVSSLPIPVLSPTVYWTGARVLAVGVHEDTANTIAATLDPADGQWTLGAEMPFGFKGGAPTPSAWTGSSLLLFSADAPVSYDLSTDTWRLIAPAPLVPRRDAASVWTGTEWVVWGGLSFDTDASVGDGAAYDPLTDTWRTIAAAPLSARLVQGVWTGTEMIVMAGRSHNLNGMMAFADGAAYDPAGDSWRPLADGPAHPGATFARTADLVLFFAKGGYSVYDVATNRWDSDFQGTGLCFDGNAALSTGTQIVLLGCYDGSTGGAVFTPG